VGFLPNTHSPNRRTVQAWWSKAFRASAASAIAPIDDDGFLRLRWPSVKGRPLSFDFLLATATRPTPPRRGYFLARELAERWIEKRHEEYFFNNVKHGITTYQDQAGDLP